uniref:Uncharacterized protein n=1 Tax=Arundo donax TaxID=35708 RepID=A0A0A9AY29_ARUDO
MLSSNNYNDACIVLVVCFSLMC